MNMYRPRIMVSMSFCPSSAPKHRTVPSPLCLDECKHTTHALTACRCPAPLPVSLFYEPRDTRIPGERADASPLQICCACLMCASNAVCYKYALHEKKRGAYTEDENLLHQSKEEGPLGSKSSPIKKKERMRVRRAAAGYLQVIFLPGHPPAQIIAAQFNLAAEAHKFPAPF